MEAAVATFSSLVLFATPRRSLVSFPSSWSPPPCKSCSYSTPGAKQRRRLICLNRLPRINSSKSSRSLLSFKCSSSVTDNASSSVVSSERWILEPAGDGDWRHIGYRVPRPSAFEIASDAVTVGRVPESADIVLPVATVSGVHARLEKKDGSLVVTDLDSTNGTYINERKLTPGFGVAIDPGSLLIFGDIHLAMFRVRKVLDEVPSSEIDGAQQETKAEVSTANEEAS